MLERRPWGFVDKAFFGIFTAWFAMGLFIFISQPLFANGEHVPLRLLLPALCVCYAAPFLFWRPRYVHTTFFPLTILLTSGVLQLVLNFVTGEHVNILLLTMLMIGYMSNRYNIWWTFPVFIIAIPLTTVFTMDLEFPLATFLNDAGISLIFFAIGFGVQRGIGAHTRMKLLLDENIRQYTLINEQNKALEQYANQVEKITLLEERNRLARELHDTVGHTFTSVIMGMDAVSYIMEISPEKAKEKLEVLRDVTRKGLDEVRRSIHQIAPDDDGDSLPQQVARLCNEFAVHTGTEVRIEVSGEERELPKQAQLTLIRCLQESLTNAKRHGQARAIATLLRFSPAAVELQVEDDGIGAGQLEKGFGLSAMKDRLSALQGTLLIESRPGLGTRVLCTVPFQTR